MSTLKGLFEPKPRCQRNFLLENKRDVKAKSTSNKEKNNIPNFAPQNFKASVRLLRSQPASLERPKFSGVPKPLSSSKEVSCKKLPDKLSTECKRQDLPLGINSSKTANYIHHENVPFQWTEVCSSLISHNICHQGVQTEENNYGNVANKVELFTSEEIAAAEFDCEDSLLPNASKATKGNCTSNNHSNVRLPQKKMIDTEFRNTQTEVKTISPSVRDSIDDERKSIVQKHVTKEDTVSNVNSGKASLNHISNGISTCVISDTENMQATNSRKLTSATKISPQTHSYPPSYQKGEIPKYLSKRKTEQALASARAKEIDPNCPPGHVAMSDTERRETLDLILKNYNELIAELNKIPVRTDTLKMKQRKIEIEKQLDKLEEGIRIFSRSKVYVKVDA